MSEWDGRKDELRGVGKGSGEGDPRRAGVGGYAYRKALFLHDLVWTDCEYWQTERRGWPITEQIVRSSGSISANIEEGHGRGYGKDYVRFLKIALGSARETQGWYWRGRTLLPNDVLRQRLALLDEIIALLVTEIQRQQRFTP